MPTVPGIDVSHWTAAINWLEVRAAGVRFCFIKATEGESYTDSTFGDNWGGTKTAGILRGAYCFFHPNQDPKKQADYFIQVVKSMNDSGELPPALDLETADDQPNDKIIASVKTWLDRVEQGLGKKPIIYSGYYILMDHFSQVGGGPPPWAKDYPLWIAQYPDAYTPGMQPALPNGWPKWTFWQYTNKGAVNGINVAVDMDSFNGTLEELYKFASAQIPPLTPKTHTIQAGDSFESVANKYGVAILELVSANPQLLKAGDKLTIPVAGGGSPPTPPKTYTVKRGDTLTAIAMKFGTTVAAIAAANNIPDPNKISVGQVLKIP